MNRLTIPPSIVFQVLDGEAVILNVERGIYFTLNGVGTRVWLLIEEHGFFEKVREAMLREFVVSPETLDTDLARLVSELCEEGLLASAEDEA